MDERGKWNLAVAAVVAASLFWATDAIVQTQTALKIDPKQLILIEHLIGIFFLAPWVVWKYRAALVPRSISDIIAFLVLGVGGSALGTIFFAMSTRLIDTTTASLLQMLQPAIVVVLASLFLREKQSPFFSTVAVWVLLNTLLLNNSDLSFAFLRSMNNRAWEGVGLSLVSVCLWGASVVFGKSLLRRYPPSVVVFWRWVICIPFLFLWILWSGEEIVPLATIVQSDVLVPLLYLSTIAGSFGMVLYYYGLKILPAGLVAFVELTYALGGVFLPIFFFRASLAPLQVFAGISLVFSIWLLVMMEQPIGMSKKIKSI